MDVKCCSITSRSGPLASPRNRSLVSRPFRSKAVNPFLCDFVLSMPMIRFAAYSAFPFVAFLASVALAAELRLERGQGKLLVQSAENSAHQEERSDDLRTWQLVGLAVRGDGSLLRIDRDISDQLGEVIFYRVGQSSGWSTENLDSDLIKKITEYEGLEDQFEVVDDGNEKTIYVTTSETQDGVLFHATVEAVVTWETSGADLNVLEIGSFHIVTDVSGWLVIELCKDVVPALLIKRDSLKDPIPIS